jgi:hypothetical protein
MPMVGFAAHTVPNFPNFLGVRDENVGIDDCLVLIALIAAIHPGQYHLDFVVATFDELFAGQGRQIEDGGMGESRASAFSGQLS